MSTLSDKDVEQAPAAPNYTSFLSSADSQESRDEIQEGVERLQMKMDEFQVVCTSLQKESKATKESLTLVAAEIESLRAVFALIDRVAVHVDKMDKAVAEMEVLLSSSAKEYNKRVISNTMLPISKWFGVESKQDMPPFRRPKHLPSFSEDFDCDHNHHDNNQ